MTISTKKLTIFLLIYIFNGYFCGSSERMTILVTGGMGFIGSNFIDHWMQENKSTVVNLDKLTYAGHSENLADLKNNSQYIFVKGSIGDYTLVSDLLDKYRPSVIVNFAAETHVDRSIHAPDIFLETNIMGTFQLLKASWNYWKNLSGDNFRFLHISTDEVYGDLKPEEAPFSEDNPYLPSSIYSASKASSDHLVRAYFKTYGLPTIITNCSNNYGPYQFPEKLIPLTIYNALEGKKLPIYGDGKQIRDWLYVTDHCKALAKIIVQGRIGETYNIGGGNEKTNIEVVQTICDILDREIPQIDQSSYRNQITFVKDRLGHDRRYSINNSKINKKLGWLPEETFESGILKTVRWYIEQKNWVKSVTGKSYQNWIAERYCESI